MSEKLKKYFPWSLIVAVVIVIFFISRTELHFDLNGYRTNSDSYYHPLWSRWLFSLLSLASINVTYFLLAAVTMISLYFSWRVFGGRHWMAFISYQFCWLLFYGQIDGIIIGGLTLAYWALENKKSYLVGLGLAIAMIKPNMTAFLMVLFWWWAPSRWKALVIPAAVAFLSFIQWGFWVPEWITRLFEFKDIYQPTATNISLWQQLGPWPLFIWPFIFLAPLSRIRKVMAVTAGTMMTVPYFPIYSSLIILPMPIPVIPYFLFQLSFFLPLIGSNIFNFLKIVPVILVIWAMYPAISNWWLFLKPITGRLQAKT